MARSVNGTTDLIVADAAHSYGADSAFSVSAWVKGAAQGNKSIYSEGQSTSTNSWFDFASDDTSTNKLKAQVANSSGTSIVHIVGTITAFDSTWHHICCTQDANRHLALFVDGVADSAGTISAGTVSAPVRVGIGFLRRSTSSAFFSGTIAHVATWTRQLAAGEIVTLAAGLPASHLAPAHYWPLWGSDSPEPDIGTGTKVPGVLTGTSPANEARSCRSLLALA